MEENILFLIKKVSSKCHRMLDEYDLKRNINSLYCVIIDFCYFYEKKGKEVTQLDIQKLLYMPKSSCSDALTYLEENGYLKRYKSESDQRKRIIKLLKKGKELSLYNKEKFKYLENELLKSLNKEEKIKFKNYLIDILKS